jgi:ribonucleoside-triphosphate reductase (thioredoxin)
MEDYKIISDEFTQKYLNKKVNWGFNGLGYIIYKRTYSRTLENKKQEEWPETIQRCINGAQKIGAQYTKEEAKKLFDYIFSLKCNFGGRSLWQLGTSHVDRFGANSLISCFYISITKLEDFCFIFENLMMGSGVGFSVRKEHIHELPKIKSDVIITHELTKDADFICPDSRQGWVELLRKVLNSFFINGNNFTYSTILVRGYGEPIKSFGGTASGPKILIDGIEKICKIFQNRSGKKLRSIDVLDIVNIIGTIVIAGNLRRSSQIALGDADDILFLRAKRWDLGNIPNWRSASNNTIVADDITYLTESLWEGYNGNGEPYGLFNLPLSQKYGRLGEKIKDNCEGGNPCNEISLCSAESCNLAELYLNNIESQEELIDCAKLLYKTQKSICSLNYLHKETNDIVHKNFRLGLGVTGICQSLEKLQWLDECYKELRKFDKEWSKKRNWPESIKLTTCKPSGTLSLLSNSTPGIHPAYAKYYIRRVRMSSNDKLVPICKEAGYKIEFQKNFDNSEDHNTVVIEFPCYSGQNVILAKDIKAIDQLELVKKIQTLWSDNSISCTVYYKKEELGEIKEWLNKNYESSIKSISFLLHSDHGFQQAPYEEITEEVYKDLIKNIKPIDKVEIIGDLVENLECQSGSCPIR